MFTGLVEATGTILALTPSSQPQGPTRITVSAPALAPRLSTGDSIAVSGVCLTALDITHTQFLRRSCPGKPSQRTTLSPPHARRRRQPGAPHSSRRAPSAATSSRATSMASAPSSRSNPSAPSTACRTKPPPTGASASPSLPASAVTSSPQGSITVEGISLTVANVLGDVVSIAIIPHTYASTALAKALPGQPLNIEVDVLAKYAERQHPATAAAPEPPPNRWTVTEAYLLANGY